jgi:hypothetical protein
MVGGEGELVEEKEEALPPMSSRHHRLKNCVSLTCSALEGRSRKVGVEVGEVDILNRAVRSSDPFSPFVAMRPRSRHLPSRLRLCSKRCSFASPERELRVAR